jgi:hypothetical protein
MPIISREDFRMEDLFLEVRLTAYGKDYTGKKTFDVNFFRKDIGFGITDISIEVNTSLQPVIEIKFKDLYGNTFSGTQDDNDIDYSVLFDWPPPKFKFSFKGYLGGPVTWLLSLKKTKIDFVPSDGSYEITASFVPNQWGFFSDIPFLFLLACKSLRQREQGMTGEAQKSQGDKTKSIFDLIKIGKKVEVKTKETTKEFEVLQQQLAIIKSGRILESTVNAKTIKFGEAIDGKVAGGSVKEFQKITINDPGKIPGNAKLKDEAQLKSFLNSASDLQSINQYLIYISDFDKLRGNFIPFEVFQQNRASDANFGQDDINAKIKILDDNIDKVDKATKAKFFESSKSELRQITISEIFRQLSKDSAYILGRILEAGFLGLDNNQSIRNQLLEEKKLIGLHYPLYINKDGEEVPAVSDEAKESGAADYEMKFVREFITALTEGLARDYDSDDNVSTALDDSKLKKRINNLEVNKENPYKPFFKNIAENIIFRSAVAAFFTGSDDVNRPGYYNTEYLTDEPDRDNIEDVIFKLADADSENITDNIIKDLNDAELLQLRRFCVFFVKLFSSDGESFLGENGEDVSVSFPSIGDPITSDILNYNVVIEKGDATGKGRQEISVGKFILSLVSGRPIQFEPNPNEAVDLENQLTIDSAFSFINTQSWTAVKFINNGIPWFKLWTTNSVQPSLTNVATLGLVGGALNTGFVVMFGEDATDATNTNSWDTDATYRVDDDYGKDTGEDWRGFIKINRYNDDEGNPTPLVQFINDSGVPNKFILNFGNLSVVPNEFYDERFMTDQAFMDSIIDSLVLTQKLGDPNNFQTGEIPAESLAIAPYSYNFDNPEIGTSSAVCFAPFSNGVDCSRQRAYIKKMCQNVLDKIVAVEQERSNVISRVLGNASQQENLIYKQFHNIFHQWNSLIDGGDDAEGAQIKEAAKNSRELEEKFGRSHLTKDAFEATKDDVSIQQDGVFIYDYPLNSMQIANTGGKKVNVANSLINIEPMYKPNSNTTVLNIIQQICTKNNFLFIPIPGSRVNGLQGVFQAETDIQTINSQIKNSIINYFHVSFMPTPESRAKLSNDKQTLYADVNSNSDGDSLGNEYALEVKFGDPSNKIIKSVTVGTEDNKPTAESILNLQRLVDKENSNKALGTNCSMLPVMEGRSYKASFDMLGCSQIFPMDYFFLKNMPLFKGLYQVMKVRHSISPNNMSTTCEGVRMRFDANTNSYAGIQPITYDGLEENALENGIQVIEGSNFKLKVTQPNRVQKPKGQEGIPFIAPENQTTGDPTLFSPAPGDKANETEINKIINVMNNNKYVVYKDGKVNIVGVRKYPFIGQPISDRFDDLIYIIWFEGGKWVGYKYACTTKPGLSVMKGNTNYPGNYLAEGQYLEVWVNTTYHDHPAFADSKKFNTYFDRNKDAVWNPTRIESPSTGGGFFQHSVYVGKYPNDDASKSNVDTWSAGCQVIPNRNKQLQFQSLIRAQAAKSGQKKYTYTLLKSSDIV